jgi:hypothetical protein
MTPNITSTPGMGLFLTEQARRYRVHSAVLTEIKKPKKVASHDL